MGERIVVETQQAGRIGALLVPGLGAALALALGTAAALRFRTLVPSRRYRLSGYAHRPIAGGSAGGDDGVSGNGAGIRVLVTAYDELTLQGLSAVLQRQHGIEVAAEARGHQDALAKTRALHPDVVVLQTLGPEADSLVFTRALREECPNTHVLVLAQRGDHEHFQHAIAAGASGYEVMQVSPAHLASAIRTVHSGRLAVSETVLKQMAENFAGNHQAALGSPPAHDLTSRGREVLILLAQGLSDKEIAAQLLVSEATVKSHLRIIYAKLRVHNRAQAATYAVQHDLVPPLPTRAARGRNTL